MSVTFSNKPPTGPDWLPGAVSPTSHMVGRSQSSQFGATIDWQELLPQNVEEAQLLLRGTPGGRVQIPDWRPFLAIYDQAIAARRHRSQSKKPA